MKELDWNKVFELLIPIVLVFLAGIIALYQMRQNVKLQANLKWKEEFRQKVSIYINALLKLITFSLKNKEMNGENDLFQEYEKLSREVLIQWGDIYMMLETESGYSNRFTKLHSAYIKYVRDIHEGKETSQDLNIGEIHVLAKKIYDQHGK